MCFKFSHLYLEYMMRHMCEGERVTATREGGRQGANGGPVVGTHISTHGEFWLLTSLEKKKEKQHWLDSFNLWEAFGCLVMVHDPA